MHSRHAAESLFAWMRPMFRRCTKYDVQLYRMIFSTVFVRQCMPAKTESPLPYRYVLRDFISVHYNRYRSKGTPLTTQADVEAHEAAKRGLTAELEALKAEVGALRAAAAPPTAQVLASACCDTRMLIFKDGCWCRTNEIPAVACLSRARCPLLLAQKGGVAVIQIGSSAYARAGHTMYRTFLTKLIATCG